MQYSCNGGCGMHGRAIATGKVTKVLALPLFAKLVFGWINFFSRQRKIPFYTRQVMNKSVRVIFGLAILVII